MTIHPDVSGRPHAILMHERYDSPRLALGKSGGSGPLAMGPGETLANGSCRIIEYINQHEGVEWVTFEEMCDEFKKTRTPPPGALMPAARGSVP